jgi:hypothetical protein
MSRTEASGAYLGGIGAMLEEADLCPSCRQGLFEHAHDTRGHAAAPPPLPALTTSPLVAAPPSLLVEAEPRTPASLQIREFETPSMPLRSVERRTPSFSVRAFERGSRSLGVLWLPPPDLGEVI